MTDNETRRCNVTESDADRAARLAYAAIVATEATIVDDRIDQEMASVERARVMLSAPDFALSADCLRGLDTDTIVDTIMEGV